MCPLNSGRERGKEKEPGRLGFTTCTIERILIITLLRTMREQHHLLSRSVSFPSFLFSIFIDPGSSAVAPISSFA